MVTGLLPAACKESSEFVSSRDKYLLQGLQRNFPHNITLITKSVMVRSLLAAKPITQKGRGLPLGVAKVLPLCQTGEPPPYRRGENSASRTVKGMCLTHVYCKTPATCLCFWVKTSWTVVLKALQNDISSSRANQRRVRYPEFEPQELLTGSQVVFRP